MATDAPNMGVEITPQNFSLVTQENGDVFQSDTGQLCISSNIDGSLYFVEPTTDILNTFNVERASNTFNVHRGSNTSSSSSSSMTFSSDNENKRVRWNRESICALIELRIQYDPKFKSTSTKKEIVWKELAEGMNKKGFTVTAMQCNDKWRYLKSRYTMKKDNQGDRGTGEAPIEFEYYAIMDEFLGKKHNVTPVGIASSSRGDTIPCTNDEKQTLVEDNEPPRKTLKCSLSEAIKQKKTSSQIYIDELKQSTQLREANRERRHEELLNVRNKAIDVFNKKMDDLVNAVTKNDK